MSQAVPAPSKVLQTPPPPNFLPKTLNNTEMMGMSQGQILFYVVVAKYIQATNHMKKIAHPHNVLGSGQPSITHIFLCYTYSCSSTGS